MEEAKKDEGPSFAERLLGNVLKNFEVNVTNIHIRYEDAVTKPGTTFAAGITLKEFTIHVCNCQISNFKFYWVLCVVYFCCSLI